jgi:hypothetical protein
MTNITIVEGQGGINLSIVEGQIASLSLSDGIREPSMDGQGYARKWDGSKFIWTAVSTEGVGGTVTSVEITSNTLTVTGSPITQSGTIAIELTANQISSILGYTPSSFSGNYGNLTGIPSEFPPLAHNHTISSVTGLQTALNLKLESLDIANFETTSQLDNRDTANRNRSNHTGTQAISTVDGLQLELDSKINIEDPITINWMVSIPHSSSVYVGFMADTNLTILSINLVHTEGTNSSIVKFKKNNTVDILGLTSVSVSTTKSGVVATLNNTSRNFVAGDKLYIENLGTNSSSSLSNIIFHLVIGV